MSYRDIIPQEILQLKHAFLFGIWDRGDASRGNGSFSRLALVSKLVNLNDSIYDVEALGERKNNTENK